MDSFNHLKIFNDYSVPDTVLGTRDAEMNKVEKLLT